MKKITLLTFIFLISVFGFSQNLLLNGGFENTVAPSGNPTGSVLLTSGTAWTTSMTFISGGIRPSVTAGANARSGSNYISLPNNFTTFRQYFTAVTGTVYTLSFWNRFSGLSRPNSVDGIYVSIRLDTGGNGTDMSPTQQLYVTPTSNYEGWNKYTLTFTAPQTNLVLVFSKQATTNSPTKINNESWIDDVSIEPSHVWNGATSANWSDASNWNLGVPNSTNANIFVPAGTINMPTISTDIALGSVTVDTGATLSVSSSSVTVSGGVDVKTGGLFSLSNNSSLIQENVSTYNSGSITVNRNSNLLSRGDYTHWSSPVTATNQFLKTFSPATLDTRFYTYNELNDKYKTVTNPATTQFAKATGYMIRMPDNAVAFPLTQTFSGVFTGSPNNGNIVAEIQGFGSGFNLIGNPYPSVLDADALIGSNAFNIEPSLYFWRKINGASGSAYAVYNLMGSTATPSSLIPTGKIQVGQGFIVQALAGAGGVIFNNTMRIGNSTAPFFKTKQSLQKDRFWLNLNDASGLINQILIGYISDASIGLDKYDAKYINDSNIALTTIINNKELSIQGRPSFEVIDVVSLNLKSIAGNEYTIALDHFDGVFASGQDLYLVDSAKGIESNLKSSSYTFIATSDDSNRFAIKYQKTLKVNETDFNSDSFSVFKKNETLVINSNKLSITNVEVYDILGKLLIEQKNVKSLSTSFSNFAAKDQVLIVKTTFEGNKQVSKKIKF